LHGNREFSVHKIRVSLPLVVYPSAQNPQKGSAHPMSTSSFHNTQ
jgi:hypothetical protein